MKILHTSDLHLGAKTENRSRIDEQREVLDEIVEISDRENVDVVAIAGDIFHTATPSAEAEDLFYDFLEKLTRNDNRVVLVVAGNHDDPKRLSACLPLAKRHNIVLCCDLAPLPTYPRRGSVQIVGTDRGFVKIEKDGEILRAGLLPYPIESRIAPSVEGEQIQECETYAQKVGEWAKIACKNFDESDFCLLVTHLYLVGAHEPCEEKKTKNRRQVKLGDSLAVPADVLPKCNYVAVGHLHSTQQVACNNSTVFYSGATTKLRWFDDQPKVLIVNTKENSPKEVLLQKAKDIVWISAEENEIFEKLNRVDKSAFVYLSVVGTASLSATTVRQIRAEFPNVLSIGFVRKEETQESRESTKNLSPKELFVQFYLAKRGEKPKDDLVEAFLSLLEVKDEA